MREGLGGLATYAAVVQVRPVRLPQDVAALSAMDASFTTNVILEVTAAADRFGWAQVPVHPAIFKPNDLAQILAAQREWSHAWVAVAEEDLVGFAASWYSSWNRREVLTHLYVDRSWRRRGAARALLQVVQDAARQHGARQVWLETQNVNLPAVRAYRALGFEVVGLDRTLYDAAVAHEVALFMAKPLHGGDDGNSNDPGDAHRSSYR